MGMRLLPKSEVAVAKAVEKKRDIDEGLKLARRIDNLRETAAVEDAAFQKHRDARIKEIHDEIAQEQAKLDPLKKEVKELEERKAEALKPLDAEWIKVADAKRELDRRGEVADEREHLLDDRDRETEATLKKATATNTKAQLREDDANRRLQHAAEQDEKATLANEKAQRIKSEAEEKSKKMNQQLLHRDRMASERERSVTLREQALAKKEAQFKLEREIFKDRKGMLEREIKRNQKSHGN